MVGGFNFKSLTCNIRSINANFTKLITVLKRLDIVYDAIVLTECWLQEDPHIPQLQGYNTFHTSKVFNKCSGVVIYIKDCWPASATEPLFDDANCLIVKINNCSSLIGIYRSPALPASAKFFDSLDRSLESLKKTKTVIVTGDMNINLLDETLDCPCSIYKDLMGEHCLLPAITLPTRDKTCLDHIFVRSNRRAIGVVTQCPLTDHNLVMVGINTNSNNKVNKKTRVSSKTDFSAVAKDLEGVNWEQFVLIDDVNSALNVLNQTITNSTQKHTQEFIASRSKIQLKPWVTPGLIRCMRHRDRLHLQTKEQPNNEILKLTYLRYKNFCNDVIRKVKTNYDNTQLSENHTNPKKLWKSIKNICDIPGPKNNSQVLLQQHNNPEVSVNFYNRHFVSKGSNLASEILKRKDTTEEILCHNLNKENRCPNSLFLAPTDLFEVDRLIKQLKPESAPGIDSFNSVLLKSISNSILVPLVHICNLSITTGIFPEFWKTAVVSPIHKSGDNGNIENYRPISLLCILSKILEKIVNKRLVDFLEKYQLLADRQFGFRRGKSTDDAVQLLTETLSSHMDKGSKSLGVFLDLARAFDTVSIPILLGKLECLGIRGNALDWLTSYLTNRRQRLKIGEYLSEELSVTFGVPQGGILSPTLFTIYMDDLLKLNIPNASLICYADDTVAIFQGKNWNNAVKAAEAGMSKIARWLDSNLLTLNIIKTNFIGFHITRATKPKVTCIKIHTDSCSALATPPSINSEPCLCGIINRVPCTKYLGIQIDQKLCFEQHIFFLSRRVRKIIHIMKKLRPAASVEVLNLVYTSLCQSLIQYCIGVWGGAAKSYMIAIERAQRAVLKVMLGKPRLYSTEKLYQEAKLLTVRQLFITRAFAKSHTTTATNTRRSTRTPPAPLPRVRTVFACRLPPFIHAFTYNSVLKHVDLRDATHRKARAKVKTWLLNLRYEETEALVKVYNLDA